MKSVAFCTLGCKVNQYETEAMTEMFENQGYTSVDFDDYADVYVINTCTVTSISDRKSRQMIRRAKRLNPDSFLIVCGCYAQVSPDDVKSIDGVDLVLGTNERKDIVNYAEKRLSGVVVKDIKNLHEFEKLSITRQSEKTRAYVKIQEGCNQFCSYCIIPYARGPIRSRSVSEIIEESNILANNGYTEIVYVGIHVASFGLDTKEADLAGLLAEINKIDKIKRIRLSSIEPMTLNYEFCEKIKDIDKLCPHFHLSLQSGCDETLNRMNRKYTTKEYKEIVDGLRRHFPDVAITTDIMVGFAGETEEEFKKTLEFTKEIGFADSHIFKYSRRKGTPADKMPNQVSPEIKDRRSKELISLCKESRDEFLNRYVGKEVEVLVEEKVDGRYLGKTKNYLTVSVESNEDIIGKYVTVTPKYTKDSILYT